MSYAGRTRGQHTFSMEIRLKNLSVFLILAGTGSRVETLFDEGVGRAECLPIMILHTPAYCWPLQLIRQMSRTAYWRLIFVYRHHCGVECGPNSTWSVGYYTNYISYPVATFFWLCLSTWFQTCSRRFSDYHHVRRRYEVGSKSGSGCAFRFNQRDDRWQHF